MITKSVFTFVCHNNKKNNNKKKNNNNNNPHQKNLLYRPYTDTHYKRKCCGDYSKPY